MTRPTPAAGEAVPQKVITPLQRETWQLACSMENPLWTIHDILTALGMMVIEMDDDQGSAAIQRLVSIAQRSFDETEELRGKLFHLNFPGANQVLNGGSDET